MSVTQWTNKELTETTEQGKKNLTETVQDEPMMVTLSPEPCTIVIAHDCCEGMMNEQLKYYVYRGCEMLRKFYIDNETS